MTQPYRPSAYSITGSDLAQALSTINAASFDDLRWSFYLRMNADRWRVTEAAIGERHWNPHDMDLDALEYALNERLDGTLTRTQRAECEAALKVIAVVREERWMRDE